MTDTVREQFAARLQEKGLSLSERQFAQFERYYELLVDWNERMNLTAITEREQVYVKHYLDSVSVGFFLPLERISNVADIGSGAGFPGLPLKILNPHLQLTIVDSLQKRIHFLREVTEQLELADVRLVHARAEDAARDVTLRERFELVTARAVARLPVLAELCTPFVMPGGSFVAMKAGDVEAEVAEASRSMRELRVELADVYGWQLPIEQAERRLVVLRKTGVTPGKYPRKAGVPAKQPLV